MTNPETAYMVRGNYTELFTDQSEAHEYAKKTGGRVIVLVERDSLASAYQATTPPPSPVAQQSEEMRQALSDLRYAVNANPSCQKGVLDRCRCKQCAMLRSYDVLVATEASTQQSEVRGVSAGSEVDAEQFLDKGLADVGDEGGILTYYSKDAVLECIRATIEHFTPAAPGETATTQGASDKAELNVTACYFPGTGNADLTWKRLSDGKSFAMTVKVSPEQGKALANVVYPCIYWKASPVPVTTQGAGGIVARAMHLVGRACAEFEDYRKMRCTNWIARPALEARTRYRTTLDEIEGLLRASLASPLPNTAAGDETPCMGANCGTTTGDHSAECLAEYAAVIDGASVRQGTKGDAS